jgi:hypothetical protein
MFRPRLGRSEGDLQDLGFEKVQAAGGCATQNVIGILPDQGGDSNASERSAQQEKRRRGDQRTPKEERETCQRRCGRQKRQPGQDARGDARKKDQQRPARRFPPEFGNDFGGGYNRAFFMGLLFIEGNRLPDFALPRLGGSVVRMADLLGKPTAFYLWAPWDSSGNALPLLREFHESYGSQVNVVGIAYDVRGPVEPMLAVRRQRVRFSVLLDNACVLSRLWGVKDLPWLITADADGFAEKVEKEITAKALHATLSLEQSAKRTRIFEPVRGKASDTQVEILLQHVANLLGRGRMDEARKTLEEALRLDPSNAIIRGSLPLVGGKV